ncbi:CRISPR-associated protein Cas4 [Desulfobacula sp.]|uniref:CRISPR-associated protein Cas4 n=1 Tax=Desulfobacula sp. TaxID=2593537 RepID=UPI0027155DAC|nr:CRISPR-associated protein Cas4 [Desulfobacula sp.]
MLIEYTFCPRFIYFMFALDIPQREEKRFKVIKGRKIHEQKASFNKEYLRKKLGVVEKQSNVYLSSNRYHIRGIIDEVLTFADNTMAPLDFKYAKYKEINYKTQKIQALCYSLMIEDNYGKKSNRAYIIYTRSKNKLIELEFNEKDKSELKKSIKEVIHILKTGFYPRRASSIKRCVDCCYKNICES